MNLRSLIRLALMGLVLCSLSLCSGDSIPDHRSWLAPLTALQQSVPGTPEQALRSASIRSFRR